MLLPIVARWWDASSRGTALHSIVSELVGGTRWRYVFLVRAGRVSANTEQPRSRRVVLLLGRARAGRSIASAPPINRQVAAIPVGAVATGAGAH